MLGNPPDRPCKARGCTGRDSGESRQIDEGGDARRIGSSREPDVGYQWRGETLSQRADIFAGRRHRGVDPVGNPAVQPESAPVYGACREQRMVETAKSHTDDEDHRQSEALSKPCGVFIAVQGHAETADALDNDRVRRRGKL